MDAGKRVKEEGLPNDLIDRLCADENFGLSKEEIEKHLHPEEYIGRCPEQVEKFIKEVIDPIISSNDAISGAALTV